MQGRCGGAWGMVWTWCLEDVMLMDGVVHYKICGLWMVRWFLACDLWWCVEDICIGECIYNK